MNISKHKKSKIQDRLNDGDTTLISTLSEEKHEKIVDRFLEEKSGLALVEYALILTLLGSFITTTIIFMGYYIHHTFANASNIMIEKGLNDAPPTAFQTKSSEYSNTNRSENSTDLLAFSPWNIEVTMAYNTTITREINLHNSGNMPVSIDGQAFSINIHIQDGTANTNVDANTCNNTVIQPQESCVILIKITQTSPTTPNIHATVVYNASNIPMMNIVAH